MHRDFGLKPLTNAHAQNMFDLYRAFANNTQKIATLEAKNEPNTGSPQIYKRGILRRLTLRSGMNTENGHIVALLARKSHLTSKQVSALEAYRTGVHLKVSDSKTRALNGKIIRKGAYYRILQQARTNAIRSLFTMIFLHHLDIIDDLTWEKISQLSAAISTSSQGVILDESAANRIISEIEQAFEKILAMKADGMISR